MKILVTNATRNAGFAVVQVLTKSNCEVIGADDRKLPFGIHSRHTKPNYLYADIESDSFVESLIRIIRKEKPDVLLPVSGTSQISYHKSELEKHTNLLVPDYISFMAADDNQITLEECRKLNIDCPEILSRKKAIDILQSNKNRTNTTRVVLKARKNIGRSEGLFYVDTPSEMERTIAENEKKYGDYIIEEFIPGTQRMKTLNLLFDKSSRLAAYFTTHKLKEWPNTGGLAALSISTNDWHLVQWVLPFFKKWRYQGVAEVELKMDPRDGKPKLIEINPRFWDYIGFPVRCGVNFPFLASKLALDNSRNVKTYPSYPVNTKYINPYLYIKATLSEIMSSKQKIKMLGKALIQLKGKKVGNFFELLYIKVNIAKMLLQLLGKSG